MRNLCTQTLSLTIACMMVVCIIAPGDAMAQFMKRSSALSLTAVPSFPTPDSAVTVSLSSYGVDMHDATIDWYVDGINATTSKNARSIVIPTGDGMRTIAIEARVRSKAGSETLTKSIAPGAVDVIAEPKTTVPERYRGVPLASSESQVRMVAVPHLYRNGIVIPKKDILFTWSVNGETLMGGAQLGTDVTTVTVPRYGDLEVAVLAEAKDGTRSARSSLTIKPTKPRMLFYEENSLYGTLMRMPRRFETSKDEIAIAAVPYYMHEGVGNGARLTHEWSVDGTSMSTGNDSHILTIPRAASRMTRGVTHTYSSEAFGFARGVGSFEVMFTSDDNAVLPTL